MTFAYVQKRPYPKFSFSTNAREILETLVNRFLQKSSQDSCLHMHEALFSHLPPSRPLSPLSLDLPWQTPSGLQTLQVVWKQARH